MDSINQIKILNVKINIISKQTVLTKIRELLLLGEKGRQLVTTNPEFVLAAQQDEQFKNIINNAWLSVADGYGIRLASKYLQEIQNLKSSPPKKMLKFFWLGLKVAWWGFTRDEKKLTVIKEVITGTDLVSEICQLVNNPAIKEQTNGRVFLLGGFGNTPRLAAENLKKQNPNLEINYSIFEIDDPVGVINKFKPDVLFVALNHPRAQKWIGENLLRMPSVKLAIGVGGAFDYISGKIKRAPKSWRGFEWFYRLIHNPRRIKRIWQAWIVFSFTVFSRSLRRNLSIKIRNIK